MSELLKTDLYHLVEGRHGRFLANPNDIYLGRSMITYGEFSEREWHLLNQLVHPGNIVIEAGANMGSFTVPIAKNVGAGGMVFAFEPQAIVFQQMTANVALNDLINVQTFNAGCGSEPGWMNLARLNPQSEMNFGGVSLDKIQTDAGIRVRIEKLDDMIDPPRLNLIKADVEGMELEVLNGAKGLIEQHRPILYLECHAEEAPPLIDFGEALGYDMYWHLPRMFNPDNFFGHEENLFGFIISKNMLCVPSERQMKVGGLRKVTGPKDHPDHWKKQSDER